jgi:hypothetical protein
MKSLNKVKHLRLLDGYRLSATFRDGFVGEVDLAPLFESPVGPLTKEFHQPGFFGSAYLDHGVISWPNGYSICSDVLRYYCEQGRVTSTEEMNSYFQTESESAAVLHDKPVK